MGAAEPLVGGIQPADQAARGRHPGGEPDDDGHHLLRAQRHPGRCAHERYPLRPRPGPAIGRERDAAGGRRQRPRAGGGGRALLALQPQPPLHLLRRSRRDHLPGHPDQRHLRQQRTAAQSPSGAAGRSGPPPPEPADPPAPHPGRPGHRCVRAAGERRSHPGRAGPGNQPQRGRPGQRRPQPRGHRGGVHLDLGAGDPRGSVQRPHDHPPGEGAAAGRAFDRRRQLRGPHRPAGGRRTGGAAAGLQHHGLPAGGLQSRQHRGAHRRPGEAAIADRHHGRWGAAARCRGPGGAGEPHRPAAVPLGGAQAGGHGPGRRAAGGDQH